MKVVVVPHTHWDREWYLPFERFRYHLVRLLDETLELLKKEGRFRHFLLDGQAVIAEDYLEIRPEREGELREAIAQGRLATGPWYTMPDEFLAGGEALIRNLLEGHRVGQRLGGVMKIGYLPDPFGHVAQMPQILRGFGIEAAFLTRGVAPSKTEFWWEAPDGSKVLTHWFAASYCNARNLPPSPEEFEFGPFRGLDSLLEFLAGLATSDAILLMAGCDHMGPQDDLPSVLEALSQKLGHTFALGSLEDYLRLLDKGQELEVIKGELRTPFFAPLLPGVLSSRIYLKQMNHRAFTLLNFYAEPLASFATSTGEPYPTGFLRHAWKLLLKNHFHDSICGTSVDEVHREMVVRFAQVEQVAQELASDSLQKIGQKVEGGEGVNILVFNPASSQRTDLVEAWVEPRLSPPQGRAQEPGPEDLDLDRCILLSPEGKAVPFRVGERTLESRDILAGVKHVEKVKISFLAEDLPPWGYKLYRLIPGAPTPAPEERILLDPRTMENEFLRVEVKEDGTLTVTDKESGAVYENIGYFEDSGDAGDEYNYEPPEEQEIFTTLNQKAEIEVAEDFHDWATIRIRHRFIIPQSLTLDRNRRSGRKVSCPLTVLVTLKRGVKRVEFRTIAENRARDHRLRAVFPTGIPCRESIAESAFALVSRPTALPEAISPFELPVSTYPQERFLLVQGDGRGVAILNKGLPEYEVTPEGIVFLTLLRCVGWLSRDDLRSRLGHAGPPYEVPEAQCLGVHVFEYAFVPYSGSWHETSLWLEAEAFTRPPLAARVQASGGLPPSMSFLRVSPPQLVVSAVKAAEDGEGIVVRLWNASREEVLGSILFWNEVEQAWETNLLEEPLTALEVEGKRVYFRAKGCEIKTLKILNRKGNPATSGAQNASEP
jgi:alpha-mannosidase